MGKPGIMFAKSDVGYVEGVTSASNPIDGVSRKEWKCDPNIPRQHQWFSVRKTKLPEVILKKFALEARGATIVGSTW